MNRKIRLVEKNGDTKITVQLIAVLDNHFVVAKGKQILYYHKNQWDAFLIDTKKPKVGETK